MVHYAFLTFSLPGHLTCMVTLAEKLIKVHPDLTVTIYTIDAAADKCAPIKAMPGLNIVTLKLGPNGGNVKELFTYSLEQPAQLADDVLLGIKNDLSSRAGVTYPSVAVSNQYGSTWGRQVAAKMGIKSYIFMPSPMIVWTVQMLLPQVYASGFDRKGFLEVPHYGLLNHLQLLDMGGMVDGLAEQCRLAQTHDGMLINDQEETYDSHYIAALKEYIPNVRFIGYLPPATDFSKPPAPKQAQSTCPEVQGPESLVLPWLDRQGPRSVIYIAMGSWVHLCKADQVELAFALEKVGRPVVWTIKKYNETVPYRPSHAGKDYKERECKVQCDEYGLPEGWLDRMGDRVLIVEWAPQTTILSHSSTGLFISHCGWNSLTECVSLGGIPIVGVPIFTDQPINAHMLEHKLKIGKNLWSNPTEGELDRHLVADTIYEVMGNQVFAENAAKLKRHNDRRWNGASGDSMKKLKEFCDEVERSSIRHPPPAKRSRPIYGDSNHSKSVYRPYGRTSGVLRVTKARQSWRAVRFEEKLREEQVGKEIEKEEYDWAYSPTGSALALLEQEMEEEEERKKEEEGLKIAAELECSVCINAGCSSQQECIYPVPRIAKPKSLVEHQSFHQVVREQPSCIPLHEQLFAPSTPSPEYKGLQSPLQKRHRELTYHTEGYTSIIPTV